MQNNNNNNNNSITIIATTEMEASFEVKRQKGREKKSKRAGDRQKHTHTPPPILQRW